MKKRLSIFLMKWLVWSLTGRFIREIDYLSGYTLYTTGEKYGYNYWISEYGNRSFTDVRFEAYCEITMMAIKHFRREAIG